MDAGVHWPSLGSAGGEVPLGPSEVAVAAEGEVVGGPRRAASVGCSLLSACGGGWCGEGGSVT